MLSLSVKGIKFIDARSKVGCFCLFCLFARFVCLFVCLSETVKARSKISKVCQASPVVAFPRLVTSLDLVAPPGLVTSALVTPPGLVSLPFRLQNHKQKGFWIKNRDKE